jgi:hypothetical protein
MKSDYDHWTADQLRSFIADHVADETDNAMFAALSEALAVLQRKVGTWDKWEEDKVVIQRQDYTRLREDGEYLDLIRGLINESDNAFKGFDLGAFLYQAIREYAQHLAEVGATPQGDDDWTQCAVVIDCLLDADIENMRREMAQMRLPLSS